jgi:hypothetical protein
MLEKIPDPQPSPLRLPEGFESTQDSPRFPTITKEILIETAESGWKRFGILVFVVNPDGDVLTVTHGAGNPKVPVGTKGAPSETMTFTRKDGAVEVEQVPDAISRLFMEELGTTNEDLAKLKLTTAPHGAWKTTAFPLNAKPGDFALGLVLVLRADEESAKILTSHHTGFTPTEEIAHVEFERAEGILKDDSNMRPGTKQAIIDALGLLTDPNTLTPVTLPPAKTKSPEAEENLEKILGT